MSTSQLTADLLGRFLAHALVPQVQARSKPTTVCVPQKQKDHSARESGADLKSSNLDTALEQIQ